ncbi:unnamed protein product [Choristocarpus tenellus]
MTCWRSRTYRRGPMFLLNLMALLPLVYPTAAFMTCPRPSRQVRPLPQHTVDVCSRCLVRPLTASNDPDLNAGDRGSADGPFTYDLENGKHVQWTASKSSMVNVEEGPRKLSAYLALPPTEYSLLDPKMIKRTSEDTFQMNCGTLNFFGTKVNPILFMKVIVNEKEGMANIMIEKVELEGSPSIRNASGTFSVSSTTIVSSSDVEVEKGGVFGRGRGSGGKGNKSLRTQASIEIDILVPNENFIPHGVLRRTGSFLMQRVLDVGLPQFTRFLRRDYGRWSQGDDERAAVAADDEFLVKSD